jgi:hypothetical protein
MNKKGDLKKLKLIGFLQTLAEVIPATAPRA